MLRKGFSRESVPLRCSEGPMSYNFCLIEGVSTLSRRRGSGGIRQEQTDDRTPDRLPSGLAECGQKPRLLLGAYPEAGLRRPRRPCDPFVGPSVCARRALRSQRRDATRGRVRQSCLAVGAPGGAAPPSASRVAACAPMPEALLCSLRPGAHVATLKIA